MEALVHYGHRCLYCGATARDARLEVDHVIPVSRGGTNDMGNLVVACRTCNIGKGKKMLLEIEDGDVGPYIKEPALQRKAAAAISDGGVPPAAWGAQRECDNLIAAWVPQFRRWWDDVEVLPAAVEVDSVGESFSFSPTLVCRGRRGCDIGPEVRILLVEWSTVGRLTVENQLHIRNAVISGYSVPTMVIMGPPALFFGVLVNERHKGTPRGRIIDQHLQPSGEWENDSWYPDESMTFEDLRSPIDPRLLVESKWDHANERFVGVYSSCDSWGLSDGI